QKYMYYQKNETQLIVLETQLGRNVVEELAGVLSRRENHGKIDLCNDLSIL
ncbi:9742_t:CDS:2, partial [Funneliformis mosseae]